MDGSGVRGWRVAVLITSLAACLHQAPAQTTVVRVDGTSGSALPDGSDWGADAFRYLQDALDYGEYLLSEELATHVDIWVAATDPNNP